jgi:hypothetical protein
MVNEALNRRLEQEHQRIVAALVQGYAAILRHEAPWHWASCPGEGSEQSRFRQGGRAALERVAERLGVTNLRERAAEVAAEHQPREP